MRDAVALDDNPNRLAASAATDELITAAHAHPADKIIIAGANQLELLVACSRHGLLNAACRSANPRSGLKADEADVLIAPAIDAEADLPCLLRCFGRALRPGGTLVIHSTASAVFRNQRQFLSMFFHSGFAAVERRACRDNAGEVWLARKQMKILAQAA